jgi:hypothetical protein
MKCIYMTVNGSSNNMSCQGTHKPGVGPEQETAVRGSRGGEAWDSYEIVCTVSNHLIYVRALWEPQSLSRQMAAYCYLLHGGWQYTAIYCTEDDSKLIFTALRMAAYCYLLLGE